MCSPANDGSRGSPTAVCVDRTSSATKNGLPPDSRAIASQRAASALPSPPKSARARARDSAGESGPTGKSHQSIDGSARSPSARNDRRNGLARACSSRWQAQRSNTGGSGPRSSSPSAAALSTSPHWRSSITSTSGSRSPSRESSSRNAANARRRSSCWSGTSKSRWGAPPIASTRRSAGKTRVNESTSRGKSARASCRARCRR